MLKVTGNTDKIFFECDDDFFQFCVNPNVILIESPTGPYADIDYTDEYKECLNEGFKFVICDPDSKIYKHKCISYRTFSKPVENLEVLDKRLVLE